MVTRASVQAFDDNINGIIEQTANKAIAAPGAALGVAKGIAGGAKNVVLGGKELLGVSQGLMAGLGASLSWGSNKEEPASPVHAGPEQNMVTAAVEQPISMTPINPPVGVLDVGHDHEFHHGVSQGAGFGGGQGIAI